MDVNIAQNLSPRVEETIKKVLGNEVDALDGPVFDPVAYINSKFPDKDSLSSLNSTIVDFEDELAKLDSSILETVREQSTVGVVAAKDLADAKDSIGDLHGKIIEILKKAEASEQLVEDICKDIRRLDIAKRHLTDTILTLARLKTLSSAVDQLQVHVSRRSYDEAAPLLEAAVQLFTHFTNYVRIPKVAELAGKVETIRTELKEFITEDFDILISAVTPTTLSGPSADKEIVIRSLDELSTEEETTRALSEDNIETLRAACECIDSLGPSVRKAIIKSFCRKQLQPYRNLFSRSTTLGTDLDAVDKRIQWIQKALISIEESFGRVLPKRWRVPHRLAIEFAEITRSDIESILSRYDPPSSAPAEALLKSLLRTLQFEKEMARKFETDLDKERLEAYGFTKAPIEDLDDEQDEVFDESAPLYDNRGELVDSSTAAGIRLKYERKKEHAKRVEEAKIRRQQRREQKEVVARLAGMDSSSSGSSSVISATRQSIEDELKALPRFAVTGNGIISVSFLPYMSSYVRLERGRISGEISSALAEELYGNSNPTGETILRSATVLFAQARNAVSRCVMLNTESTLKELFSELMEEIASYAGQLMRCFPHPLSGQALQAHPMHGLSGDIYKLDPAEQARAFYRVCLVAATAEYCASTVPKFSESVQRALQSAQAQKKAAAAGGTAPEAEVKEKEVVLMDDGEGGPTQAVFHDLSASAISTAAAIALSATDPALIELMKTDWSSLTDVGDQSPFVGKLHSSVRTLGSIAKKTLEPAHFRVFADKFVRLFLKRFQQSLYRCQRVGELGAQQLLVDVGALQGVLLSLNSVRPLNDSALVKLVTTGSLPSAELEDITEEEDGAPPAVPSYSKLLSAELQRCTSLLKLLSSPKERFADSVNAVWAGAEESDLIKVMDLRGFNKKDKDEILLRLGYRTVTVAQSLNLDSSREFTAPNLDKMKEAASKATKNFTSVGSNLFKNMTK